jgi:hypothetical protein
MIANATINVSILIKIYKKRRKTKKEAQTKKRDS